MLDAKYESHSRFGSCLLPFICRSDTICGNVFPPHWHENIEILHCIEGEGDIIINGISYDFTQGTIAIVNPNELHIIRSDKLVKCNCIIIFDNFCRENGIDTDKLILEPIIKNEKIIKLHTKIYENFNTESILTPLKVRFSALELLYNLYENFSAEFIDNNVSFIDGIKSAIEYTNRNYFEDISLNKIASISNLSKYYFTKRFKEVTGNTYTEFLNNVRCNNAAKLLKQGKSINEACFSAGFNDPAYFSRVFKKILGVPPSKYYKT